MWVFALASLAAAARDTHAAVSAQLRQDAGEALSAAFVAIPASVAEIEGTPAQRKAKRLAAQADEERRDAIEGAALTHGGTEDMAMLLKDVSGTCAQHKCGGRIEQCETFESGCATRVSCAIEGLGGNVAHCWQGVAWSALGMHEVAMYNCLADQACLPRAAASLLQERMSGPGYDQASYEDTEGLDGYASQKSMDPHDLVDLNEMFPPLDPEQDRQDAADAKAAEEADQKALARPLGAVADDFENPNFGKAASPAEQYNKEPELALESTFAAGPGAALKGPGGQEAGPGGSDDGRFKQANKYDPAPELSLEKTFATPGQQVAVPGQANAGGPTGNGRDDDMELGERSKQGRATNAPELHLEKTFSQSGLDPDTGTGPAAGYEDEVEGGSNELEQRGALASPYDPKHEQQLEAQFGAGNEHGFSMDAEGSEGEADAPEPQSYALDIHNQRAATGSPEAAVSNSGEDELDQIFPNTPGE